MSNSERIWNVVFLAFLAAFIVACHLMEWYVLASINSITYGMILSDTIKLFRS